MPMQRFDTSIDPDLINTRAEFAHALNGLRTAKGLSQRYIAGRASYSATTISDYCSGRRLPSDYAIRDVLSVIFADSKGEIDQGAEIDRWIRARDRVRPLPSEYVPKGATSPHNDDHANLLFRVYIPAERLYAAEAQRLLSLFRDWLVATRGHRVRQTGYQTGSGNMYEFFVDASTPQADLRQEFDKFSDFLTLCSENPATAAELLASARVSHARSVNLVDRFGREVRRLQIDLRHERERRMLTIRHSLEEQLLENQVDLRSIPVRQLNAMVESLVPGPSAPESLALLAVPWTQQPTAPVTINISPQIISAAKSTIIQNVQGVVHLGAQAQELLALVDRYGGQEKIALQSAVHELEDTAAPPANRSAAKRLLKNFLSQVAGVAHDVAIDLLKKYLESKAGL